jgi:hypothetical protein
MAQPPTLLENLSTPDATVWMFRENERVKHWVYIVEPASCLASSSDVAQVITRDEATSFNGAVFRRVVLRLQTNGACDLQIYATKGKVIGVSLGRYVPWNLELGFQGDMRACGGTRVQCLAGERLQPIPQLFLRSAPDAR